MTHIEAMKLGLEYAEGALSMFDSCHQRHPATELDRNAIVRDIEEMRQAIEQAEQAQPVAWIFNPNTELLWPDEVEVENPSEHPGYKPLYTTPPRQPEQATYTCGVCGVSMQMETKENT